MFSFQKKNENGFGTNWDQPKNDKMSKKNKSFSLFFFALLCTQLLI